MFGFLTRQNLKVIADTIARATGITLQPGRGWAANVDKKVIFYPSGTVFTEDVLSFIIHEAAHIKYTAKGWDSNKALELVSEKLQKDAGELFFMLNAMEDRRVEVLIGKDFKGAPAYMEAGNNTSVAKNLDMIDQDEDHANYWKTALAIQFCWKLTCEMDPLLDPNLVTDLQSYIDKDVAAAVDQITPEQREEIITAATTEDMFKSIQQHVFPLYLPFCKDLDPNQKDKQQAMEKILEALLEALQELAEAAEQAAQEEDEDDESGSKQLNRAPQDLTAETADQAKKERKKKSAEQIKNEMKNLFDKNKYQSQENYTADSLDDVVKNNLAGARKAISILKDVSIVRDEPGHRSGKIDKRKIVKVSTGATRIFTRRHDTAQTTDVTVSILIDISGSMRGKRIKEAVASCALLGKALELTKKEYSVSGFGEGYRLFKPYKHKFSLDQFAKIQGMANDGCTHLGYGMNKVMDMVNKQPNRNKILIVITDGQPDHSGGFDEKGNYCDGFEVTHEIRKAEAHAEVYGIGIQHDGVTELFKNSAVINNVSELPEELMKIFKKISGKRVR